MTDTKTAEERGTNEFWHNLNRIFYEHGIGHMDIDWADELNDAIVDMHETILNAHAKSERCKAYEKANFAIFDLVKEGTATSSQRNKTINDCMGVIEKLMADEQLGESDDESCTELTKKQ